MAVANYAIFRGDAYIGTDDVTHLHRSSHRLGAALHLHGLCLQHGVQPVRDVCISDRHGALSTTSTFASEADASIIQASPSTNYGSLARIQTDGSPVKNFLIRFTVTGVGTSPVTGATLRLTCLDPSPRGGDLSLASSNVWAESTVTWNTAPAAGSTVSSLGPVVSRSTYGFDVSSLVHADGTYTFRATSPSTDGAEYASKEGALETRPQLIVTTAG